MLLSAQEACSGQGGEWCHSHQWLQESCTQKDWALNAVGRSSSLSLKAGGFESNPSSNRGKGTWTLASPSLDVCLYQCKQDLAVGKLWT